MDALASPARPQASSSSALGYADSPIKPPTRTQDTSIDASQQNAAPQQDLWSSILNSVKSSKAISTKNIVLLGEPKSGKTSLLSALASTSPVGLINGKSSYTQPSTSASTSKAATIANDLGLAYAYFDVGDEKDRDEIVARVGAYTLHSSQPAYTSLLHFAFPEPNLSSTEEDTAAAMSALASATNSASTSASASETSRKLSPKASIDSLKDSIVVILLDWEQPWTFLEQLRNWLNILRELVDGAAEGALSSQQQRDAKWSRTRVALDEMKDRLEAYIRAYVEPIQKTADSSSSASAGQVNGASKTAQSSAGDDSFSAPITTVSVQLDNAEANPLAEGTLTDNLGIPIVVVCTKADAIPRLERDKEFKEEQFDYIQEVLRTICMKYGAALFYTSSVRAQSIDILRSYLLHRLFTPSSSATATTTQQSSAAGGTAVFGFPYRASTTDRDTLLVPAGWDSWGKIKALREPFDAAGMSQGWENDCQIDRIRRTRGLERTKEVEDTIEKELQAERRGDADTGSAEDVAQSAMKLYEDIVSDWEAGPMGSKDVAGNKVRIPDEQAFLGQHHATLAKDPDPRSKFSKKGVVGPMTGSSAGLPSVEKYMTSRDSGRAESATSSTHAAEPRSRPEPSKREATSAAAAAAGAAMTSGAGETSSSSRNSRPSSPAVSPGGATSPGGGAPKQSEVLHSFFQSLLKDKGSSVGSPKVDRMNRTSSSAGAGGARRGDPPSSSSK